MYVYIYIYIYVHTYIHLIRSRGARCAFDSCSIHNNNNIDNDNDDNNDDNDDNNDNTSNNSNSNNSNSNNNSNNSSNHSTNVASREKTRVSSSCFLFNRWDRFQLKRERDRSQLPKYGSVRPKRGAPSFIQCR